MFQNENIRYISGFWFGTDLNELTQGQVKLNETENSKHTISIKSLKNKSQCVASRVNIKPGVNKW